ncbi:MAG: GGDEF domain-containing protein [Dehalococcoidia bacterium]
MDIRSVPVGDHPEVEQAMRMSRIFGFGSWGVGLVIFGTACFFREPWLFAAFGAWYAAIAVIVSVVAQVPRKRQAILDKEWGRRFQELATRDELTGLHNRRYFNLELEEQFVTCKEQARPLTLALVDLNDFKSINDTFGHAAGDMALRIAGQAILDSSPGGATVARTGGDEFAIIMPNRSRADGEAVASRIRAALESVNFVVEGGGSGRGAIQATVGVATLSSGHDPSGLLQEADSSLYERKRTQRAA